MENKYKVLATLGTGAVVLASTASTFAADVTSSGTVTLTSAETAWIGQGVVNMATSLLSVGITLLPYIFAFGAVIMVLGYVKGFIKRK